MIGVVLAVWLVGTWVTKYSLSEMAVLTPIAVAALGLLAGVILLWVKVIRDSLRAAATPSPKPTPLFRTVGTDPTRLRGSAGPAMAAPATSVETPSDCLRTFDGRCTTVPGRSIPATTPQSRRSRTHSSSSETTASILVRRGYRDVDLARAFVVGEIEPHDPFLLGDMALAVDRIRAAIADGKRICVHGDYDVDGICATALAVLTLRTLGADVEWHLPSRFEEGYGVSGDTISRLADEGCSLLVTVDCGITAVEEVAAAKARGLEVIVTDHHRPGATLPDCPIVATRPSDYPFPELCGTGVVCKLGPGAAAWTSRRTSTSSRSRRSPTSSRSWTRTARSRSPGCARSPARSARACRR